MSESDDERRRGERIPVNREFSLLSSDGRSATWVSDLSATGVFLHTEELAELGSRIELRFSVLLDPEDPVIIETPARVVRHSKAPLGMGVEFIEMSADMRERVTQVLARAEPLDSGEPLATAHSRPLPSFAPPPAIDPDADPTPAVSEDDHTQVMRRPADED